MEKKTYNKKEIFQKINQFEDHFHKLEQHDNEIYQQLIALMKTIKKLLEENDTLRKDIDMLSRIAQGTLGEASGCQLFVLKSYRNTPVIFKDGKLLSNEEMNDCRISWDRSGEINVEVNNY